MTERGSSFYATAGRLSAIITILPASMAAGWVLGHYGLDRYLGTAPWGGIIFILIGAGVGFYEIARILFSGRRNQNNQSPDDHS